MIFLCAFWNLNALKDWKRIVRLSLLIAPIRARYGVYFMSSSLIYIVSYWSLQKPSWWQYFVITDCNVKTEPYQIIFYMFFLTLKWHRSLNFLSPLWITCPLWYYAMLCHCEDMECFETSLSKTIPALNGWMYFRISLSFYSSHYIKLILRIPSSL